MNEQIIVTGHDAKGQSFTAMTSQEWAHRFDLSVEYANYQAGRVWEEEAWARSLGFAHAEEYHRESEEAFAESVREERDWDAIG